MRTPRILTATAAALVGASALVGATTTASSADEPTAITYNCTTPLGPTTIGMEFTLPDALTAAPLPAGQPVPEASGMLMTIDIPKELSSQINGLLGGLGGGTTPLTADLRVGDATAPISVPFPNSVPVPSDGSAFQLPSGVGTVGTFSPSGTGIEDVLAPSHIVSDLTGLGIPVPCDIDKSADAKIGTVEFSGEDTTSQHLTATLKGKVITATATLGSGSTTSPGTGTVKATGKVKVAKATKAKKGKKGKVKTVAKAVTVSAPLKDGVAKLTLKLPKGIAKGSYKFTVTWGTASSVVTYKVK